MVISVEQVLINEKRMEVTKKIQKEQCKKPGVGVAPILHEIARGLIDKVLAGCMRGWMASHEAKIY